MLCPICLESLPPKPVTEQIITICCITRICDDCAADLTGLSSQPQASPTPCQLCKLNLDLGGNSVSDPVIQTVLRRQAQDLLDLLTGFSQRLEKAVTNFKTGQAAFAADLVNTAPSASSNKPVLILQDFIQAKTKEFQLELTDLTDQAERTKIRTEHLTAWLQQDQVPLSIIVISTEWNRQIYTALESAPNDSINKLGFYRPYCWYRHEHDDVGGNHTGYLILPEYSHSSSVLIRRVNTRLYSATAAFLSPVGNVILYGYDRDCHQVNFTIELLDLNLLATVTLASSFKTKDVVSLEIVAPISSGYVVAFVHRDSGPHHLITAEVVIMGFNQSGLWQWSQPITVKSLVQIVIYDNMIIAFGRDLDVYSINTAGLTKLSSTSLCLNTYHKFWRDNNLIYFRNNDSQRHLDGRASFYRFNLDRCRNQSLSVEDLEKIYANDVVAEPLNDLRLVRPMKLPGKMGYWAYHNFVNTSDQDNPHMIVDSQGSKLLVGNIVTIPDLWGRVYRLVE